MASNARSRKTARKKSASSPPSTVVSESEFCEMLSEFFRPYVEATGLNDQISCIRNSLEQFISHLKRAELENIYLEFIYSLLKKFCTTTPNLTFSVYMHLQFTETKAVLKHFPQFLHLHLRTFAIYMGKSTNSSFWLFQLFQDFATLKRLLRYGARFEFTESSASNIVDILSGPGSHLVDYLIDFDSNKRLEEIIDKNYETSDKLRRLNFIFFATDIGIKKKEDIQDVESYIKSLDLLFQTIPEPFITVSEIFRFLDVLVQCENKEIFIKEVCDKFVEEFPSSKGPIQPRNLRHLCCCRIRELLTKSKNLPHGVWRLKIPMVLRNYILFYKKEDRVYTKHLSALFSGKRPRSNARLSK